MVEASAHRPSSSAHLPAHPHVLREYAFIADGERGALIGPRGELAWLCAPHWHSPAIFGTLIGGGGVYEVRPHDDWFVWGGYYLQKSLIWVSRWTTASATIECHYALAYPGAVRRGVLLHRIVAVKGDVTLLVRFGPRSNYGRRKPRELHRTGTGWYGEISNLHMRWSGLPEARDCGDGELAACLTLTEGETHDLTLELSETALPQAIPDPRVLWTETESTWRRSVPSFESTIAPGDVQHSYAVLLGMTSTTGAMVAATTSSLPERSGEGRDYDYRYAWIRDQCYVGQGVAVHGPHPLLDSAVHFVSERILADGPNLRPLYTVTGEQPPSERKLSLPGYPGGYDRVGNRARSQFQLDVFGEALLLFACASAHDRLDAQAREAARIAASAIQERWQQPDAGVWELDEQPWTHSRLICAAGLRAAARMMSDGRAADYSALADKIVAQTAASALHRDGRWCRTPQDDRLDAALLFPALRGAIPADDPRSLATVHAIKQELGVDSYVYRFRHDQRPLGDAEGAFLLCGFVMAMAEHQVGNAISAVRHFERNRASCGPPGLFTEEYDVTQRQLRGNLPQAFVHGALIEAASRLSLPPR